MEKVVSEFLKNLNIPISGKYCEKLIVSHPDYPSILSVADVLERLGIGHQVTKVGQNKVTNLPYPCLLHLKTGGGSLLPVINPKDIESNTVQLQDWSGVLIKVESTDQVADQQNNTVLSEERRSNVLFTIFVGAIVGILALSLILSFSWSLAVFLILTITGVLTGYFLFAKELGITYVAVEYFCNTGTLSGCGKVLKANEGKLFGFITFSDAAFIYFTGQLIIAGLFVTLTLGIHFWTTLAWLSVFAVPVMLYSIWLQAFKIKAWCPLCLVVNAVLFAQLTFFGIQYFDGTLHPLDITGPHVLGSLLVFTCIGSAVLLLKQKELEANQSIQNQVSANRVKNSHDVFLHLLKQQERVDATPFEREFRIGHADAPINLLIAVNLYCGPCKTTIEQALELASVFPKKINFALRFLRSRDGGHSSDYFMRYWMEHASGETDEVSLIRNWYSIMHLDSFQKNHPMNMEKIVHPSVQHIINSNYEWVVKSDIRKTPSIFVNGYELPDLYRIGDLIPLVSGLSDMKLSVNTKMNMEPVAMVT